MVSKKELKGMKSELHTNPVEQCCSAVVPCGTMVCNMADNKETARRKVEQRLEAQCQSSLFLKK